MKRLALFLILCAQVSAAQTLPLFMIIMSGSSKLVANAANSNATTSFSANWNLVKGGSAYTLDVSTDPAYGSFQGAYHNFSVSGVTQSVTGLTAGTVYYYRLKATSKGKSLTSNSITTAALTNAPTATAATPNSTASFIAHWRILTGATGYQYDVATDNAFASILSSYNSIATTDTFATISGLSVGTPYFYRVRGVDAGGASANSNTISDTTTGATVHYIATNGGTGSGAIGAPWRLSYALGAFNTTGNDTAQTAGKIAAGDTIYVRGGTYTITGTLYTMLNGGSNAPIVVRAYQKEKPSFQTGTAGSDTVLNGIRVRSNYTWYWGLEYTSPCTRDSSRLDWNYPNGQIGRGQSWVFDPGATGNKLINCVIHDLTEGIYVDQSSNGNEVNGCIIYNNGFSSASSGRDHGHNLYLKNQSGAWFTAKNNISFWSYDYGIQGYSGGSVNTDSMWLENNIQFQSGVTGGYYPSLLKDIQIGNDGGDQPTQIRLINNSTYGKSTFYYTLVDLADNYYNNGHINHLVLRGNYFPTQSLINRAGITDTCTGNYFWGAVNNLAQDSNSYSGNWWASGVPPHGVYSRVFANSYETKRAHIAVYDWDTAMTVKVGGFSSILADGDSVYVYDVQNLTGSPALSTLYHTGDSLTLPMNGTTVMNPLGTPHTNPVHTNKEFGAYFLQGVTPVASGPTVITDTIRLAGRDGIANQWGVPVGQVTVYISQATIRAFYNLTGPLHDEAGLEFKLNIPQGKTIDSCYIYTQKQGVFAWTDGVDSLQYDAIAADSVPIFDVTSTVLFRSWKTLVGSPISQTGTFNVNNGDFVKSVNLAPLLQAVVNRAGFVQNGYTGFILSTFHPAPASVKSYTFEAEAGNGVANAPRIVVGYH